MKTSSSDLRKVALDRFLKSRPEDRESKAYEESWWGRNGSFFISVIFLLILNLVVGFWRGDKRATLLSGAIFGVAILALMLLGIRFRILEQTLDKFFRFLALISLAAILFGLFNWLSQFTLNKLRPRFQMVVFIIWGLLLAFALLLIATERNRGRLFSWLQRIGAYTPVAYSLNLLMIAVIFFSSVTYVLVQHGTLRLNAPAESIRLAAITKFYYWHFLESVPLLKVNETLRWKEPLTYDSSSVGLALLMFKLTVIIPVIAAFASYWGRPESRPKEMNDTISEQSKPAH